MERGITQTTKPPTYEQYMQLKLKYRNMKKAYDILKEAIEYMEQNGDYAQNALYEAGCVLNSGVRK